MACWIVGSRLSDGCGCMASSRLSYGCRQVRSASPVPATNASFAAAPVAPRARAACSWPRSRCRGPACCRPAAARRTPASSWPRACRCRAPMRTAPLILSSTAVVLCSSDGSMTSRFERVDGRQFPPAVVAQLAGVVGGRDGGGIGHVQRREAARAWPAGRPESAGQSADAASATGWLHGEVGRARSVPVVQGGVVGPRRYRNSSGSRSRGSASAARPARAYFVERR